MSWVTPSNTSGSMWMNPTNIRDDNETTYAMSTGGGGLTPYIEATVSSIQCDKIRFKAPYDSNQNSIEIDAYYDGAYNSVYLGAYLDNTWVEKDVVPATPGLAKEVTKMRIRFNRQSGYPAKIYEVDFNLAQSVIPNMIKHYENMRAV
jgi:hypothetical protein